MKWTKEKIDYLEEKWGTLKVETIADKLGTTLAAVIMKAKRLGLGSPYNNTDSLNMSNVCQVMGVEHKTVRIWIKHGLKMRRRVLIKKEVWAVKIEDLEKWLKENMDKWDSRKMEQYALGKEPEWLKEKRKIDLERPLNQGKKWTNKEDKLLISYVRMGLTQKEIGEKFFRSEFSVNRRVSRLKDKGLLPKNILIPWTEEENEILLEMDRARKTDKEIAWELGRDVCHIIDYRRNLKNKGLYPGHKNSLIALEDMEKIIKLKDKGYKRKEIAEILGVHETTVYRRLKKYA